MAYKTDYGRPASMAAKDQALSGSLAYSAPPTDATTPSEDLSADERDTTNDQTTTPSTSMTDISGIPTPESSTAATAATDYANLTRKNEAVRSDLERMSRACIEAFNDRDFDYANTQDRLDFRDSVSPTFAANMETFPGQTMNWKETGDLNRKFVAWEANAKFEIVHMSTDVHGNGNATVYAEVMMSGVKNLNFSRFIFMKWKIVGSRWLYYSCTTMGGASNRGLVV